MTSFPIDLPASNTRNQIVAGVTNVLPNLDQAEANFQTIEAALNDLNTIVQAIQGGGGAATASQLLVVRTNFTKLLAAFTGTQAQELFDFIDGLDLLSNIASITSFTSTLSGFDPDLVAALDRQITLNYTLGGFGSFTALRYVLNGIEISQEIPIVTSGQFVGFPISPGVRRNILAVNATEISSFLRGTLSDGRQVTSPPVVLTQGAPPIIPFLYSGIVNNNNIELLQFTDSNRIQIVDNTVTFTIGPNEIVPHDIGDGDEEGPVGMFAFPLSLTEAKLINTAIGVDELTSWSFRGQVKRDGIDYVILGAGPLVLGATFTYEATFT